MALGAVAVGATNYGVTLADAPNIAFVPVLQYWYLYALFVVMVGFWALYRAGLGLDLIVAILQERE